LALSIIQGLILSLLIGVLSLAYLKPVRAIKVMLEKNGIFWSRSLTSTVLMSGMLGAMSICFNGCDGYCCLIDNAERTITLGLLQISKACACFVVMFGVWFLILHTLRMRFIWKDRFSSSIGRISIGMIVAGILGFYMMLHK